MTARKHHPTPGMFDDDALLEGIASTDHVLWRINDRIEWERFRPSLGSVFTVVQKGPVGRPLFDSLMMN